MKFQWRLPLLAVLLGTIISGCSVQSPSKPAISTTEQSRNNATKLLTKAASANPTEAARLRVEAAQILLSLDQQDNAFQVLESIDISLLDPSVRFSITKLKVEGAIGKNQPNKALEVLSQLKKLSPTGFSKAQEITLLQLEVQALNQQGNTFPETQALIRLSLLLDSDTEKQARHNEIWNRLLQLDKTELSDLLRSGNNNYYEQGWLELINELSNNTQLDTQYQAINNWAQLWESHPAKTLPPSSLNGLNSNTKAIQKIAILLPFEGPLARPATAIKEGILMAHFRQQQPNTSPLELLFLDAEKINTPIQLAAILEQEQIDLVIGPLSKDYVSDIANDIHIRTPILALNHADNAAREGLYQFGLSNENEAIQIADKAWNDGIRNAAILTPNQSWGKRIAAAFTEHFTSLGGHVVSTQTFGETSQFSTNISTFLGTDKSTQRYKKVRQAIYTRKIEFEEYRRQDIDAIILTALPNDARQLTPILAFNFAGDIPIYATSHLHSGTNNPVQDQDLNRIKFLDIPWNLLPPSQNKILIAQTRTDTNTRFGRLYALGLDAYRIYPYLQQLSALPSTRINGETGKLSINHNGIIQRKLIWAEYKEGSPITIE